MTPLTPETEWQASLKHLPTWNVPRQPILIVAPHPDDETLGTGGLIAGQRSEGLDVVVVAVTDGENCYPGDIGLGDVRRKEQEGALERLGVTRDRIVRLRLPDSSVASKEVDLIHSLIPLVSLNTQIVAPWPGDFHPDHEVCGRAAAEVARRAGCSLTFYFFWTWHRGTPALVRHLPLRSLALDETMQVAKAEALLHHKSQLEHASGNPILPDLLLAPARRPYEIFVPA